MVDSVEAKWNRVRDTIIDWYQVLEPIYNAQEKALTAAVP